MQFLEKDLEEIIYKHRHRMYDRGLKQCNHDLMYRQFNLGSYGICDLLGVRIWHEDGTRFILLTIYELKKEKIDLSAFAQAFRYRVGISRAIDHIDLSNTIVYYSVCLIGKSIQSDGDFCFLLGNIHNVHAYTYDYSFDGIVFNQEYGYRQSEEKLAYSPDILKDIAITSSYAKDTINKAGTLERQESD